MGLTTDRNDPCLGQSQANGQDSCYLVLSDEEKAKGFVRPVRASYVHAGVLLPEGKLKMLSDAEKIEWAPEFIALWEFTLDGTQTGHYLTQKDLESLKGRRVGGCGAFTSMHQSIAETYARDPGFYKATFCIGCGKHLPVREFVWAGTNETMGS